MKTKRIQKCTQFDTVIWGDISYIVCRSIKNTINDFYELIIKTKKPQNVQCANNFNKHICRTTKFGTVIWCDIA